MVKKFRRIYMEGGLICGVTGFEPFERFDVIDFDLMDYPEPLCRCKAGKQKDGDGKIARHWHSQRVCNANGEY